ncbi:MAG: DMT family transporter, partial [Clostridia bacterium]|nr:DMT family transporter [Clostridia bacterium]
LLPLLYAGIISGGIGFTLQAVALKMTDPSIGSLIMSLESVFALLLSWMITGERLLAREYIGCLLVFMAVILSQIPTEKLKLKKK